MENGDIDSDSSKKLQNNTNSEPMEVDNEETANQPSSDGEINHDKDEEISLSDNEKHDDCLEIGEDEDDDGEEEIERENNKKVSDELGESVNIDDEDDDDVTEIIDDDDDEFEVGTPVGLKNGLRGKIDEPIELNDDSGDGEGDVMIIDEPKENGRISDELEVSRVETLKQRFSRSKVI